MVFFFKLGSNFWLASFMTYAACRCSYYLLSSPFVIRALRKWSNVNFRAQTICHFHCIFPFVPENLCQFLNVATTIWKPCSIARVNCYHPSEDWRQPDFNTITIPRYALDIPGSYHHYNRPLGVPWLAAAASARWINKPYPVKYVITYFSVCLHKCL